MMGGRFIDFSCVVELIGRPFVALVVVVVYVVAD